MSNARSGEQTVDPTVLIVARAPVPGEAKTRLAAYVGDDPAARLAGAALLDTIAAAEATGWPVCIAMTGDLEKSPMREELGEAMVSHRRVSQRGGSFAERLAAAHRDADRGGGVVQIGMDTPQAHADDLRTAGEHLSLHDAVLGRAYDGGWWLLGVRESGHAQSLRGVPMSTDQTAELTHAALQAGGARVKEYASMTDVDTWADAVEVAAAAPGTRFGKEMARVRGGDLG